MSSVFPYAGYMVLYLHDNPDLTLDNIGARAGLLASVFMAGRTLCAYHWGKAADVYGRTVVLQACLILSALFSLLFGTAQTYRQALVWRFCLGMSNGIISTAKTAATELAQGNQKLERRSMGLVMGMRSWSYLVGPALGGLLAEPLQQYPNLRWLHSTRWVQWTLTRFPYLVPNLLAAVFSFLTVVALQLWIHETLPAHRRRHVSHLPADVVRWVRQRVVGCHSHSGSSSNATSVAGEEDDEQVEMVSLVSSKVEPSPALPPPPSPHSIWSRPKTRRHMLSHWSFAFCQMCADEAFPLFCMASTGGLGLTEASIGSILSTAGALFAVSQYLVFSTLVSRVGEYAAMNLGTLLGIQPSILIPLALLDKQETGSSGEISWWSFALLSFVMGSTKLFGSIYFTSLALSINKTVPDSQRATMNGMVVVGASAARAVAPLLAGAFASFSFSSGVVSPRYGAVLLYVSLSLLGLVVSAAVWNLRQTAATSSLEENKVPVHDHSGDPREVADPERHEHTV